MQIDRPTSLEEAVAALADDPAALLLAGGTDVMVGVNFGDLRPEHVIALRRVPELKEWAGRFIAAGITYQRMEQESIVALAELSRTVGSPQIRSVGTLGGNLGTSSPAGDALPFLSAIDAAVHLVSSAGTRKVAFGDFMIGPKQNARRDDEIILGVELPNELPERQAFGKIGVRNAMVIATVSACVTRASDGTTRVSLGSVGPTIIRARQAERLASSEIHPNDSTLAEFARVVSEEVRPITDHRSTSDYRRHASGVLARRLLERCLS